MTATAKPMKPFHKLTSQFVIRVKIAGVLTHIQLSGGGAVDFKMRAGSLQRGNIRAKGGETIEVEDATKFNWQAAKSQFETIMENPGLFSEIEAMAIFRIS